MKAKETQTNHTHTHTHIHIDGEHGMLVKGMLAKEQDFASIDSSKKEKGDATFVDNQKNKERERIQVIKKIVPRRKQMGSEFVYASKNKGRHAKYTILWTQENCVCV